MMNMRMVALVSVACVALTPLLDRPCMAAVSSVAETTPHTVLVLPARVHVLRTGLTKLEEMPDWEADARMNLDASLVEALGKLPDVALLKGPSLSAEEDSRVDEFVGVATLAAASFHESLWSGFAAKRRARADRTLGSSLAFLRERYGADYVVGTFAYQLEQSKPLAAATSVSTVVVIAGFPAPWLVAMTGSYVTTFMADLRTGEVRWFNVARGYEIGGYNIGDLRDPESVRKTVGKLVETFPGDAWASEQKSEGTPESGVWRRPDQGRFTVRFPTRWMIVENANAVLATLDGRTLNSVSIDMRDHRESTQLVARQTDPRTTPELLAEYYVEQLKEVGLPDLEIADVSTDRQILGRPAFRVRYRWSMPKHLGGARIAGIASGTVTSQGVLIAELNAPALSYFEKALPDFESAVESLKLQPRRHLY